MKTITITTYASMPGRYKIKCEVPGRFPATRDAKDAGEAAAVALDYRGVNGSGPYVIVGTEKALALIPEGLRHGT